MNKELIERLRNFDLEFDSDKILDEAADALEAADKRIAELEALLLAQPFRSEREKAAECKLAVAREELLRCKRIMLRECGIGVVDENVLAQIGGDDEK